jgi:hypothetical protein
MNAAAELRRQYRAARHLARAAEIRRRLDDRTARATATLAAALAGAESTTVPGYAVRRTADGIAVVPVAPANADQLRLWREISERSAA